MRLKPASSILASLTLACLLTACGGGGSGQTASPSSPTTPATPTTPTTPPTSTTTTVLSVAYPVNPALRIGIPSSLQTPVLTNVTESLPTTFSITQGSLPPGLTLNADGTYSGTPTQAGAFDFTISANNDVRLATDAIHVSVVPADYEFPLMGDPGVASFRPAANAPAYYVDSVHGLDSNDGKSTAKAWKTITKLNAATLKAGDVVRLARGSVWTDTLRFDLTEPGTAATPIVVEAYGSGDAPTISVAADKTAVYVRSTYITLLDLRIRGGKIGFQTSADSSFVVIAGNEIVDTGMGIYAEGTDHRFLSNYIHDLHIIRNTPGGNDDYGAEGVVMMGSNMEAAWNRLVNCIAPSYDFEVDGGAFETWGSAKVAHIYIHHNLADNVDGFMELTNNTDDLVIAHNLIINSRGGLCFHIDDIAGSVYTYSRVRFQNNVVYRNPKVQKSAVFTFLSKNVGQLLPGNDMMVYDNIICSNRRLTYNPEALGANFHHENNLYDFTTGGSMGTTPLGATEKIGDPKFVDPSKTDFRLMPGSPAINAAGNILYPYDLDGVPIIQNVGLPDIGAYERK
ncbi:MAG: putative Ig domain-containing protein [Verrucomicrobia bacterium]|nr:putative Ig domain-containing protein [Verrucomicrobiota bacterium]